jgi:hypothetical protein
MKRIKELLSVKNDDNKIEIEAEIYNILDSKWRKHGTSKKIMGINISS